MGRLFWLLPLLLLLGCAKPDNSIAEWQEQQNKANQEYQRKYQALTENLTGQVNQQNVQIAQLNADKANLTNRIKYLENQVAGMYSVQEITELRQQLASVNSALGDMTLKQAEAQARVNALAASEYELTRQRNDVQQALDALWGKLRAVTGRSDITCSTNTTDATRKAFYELWDIWIKTLEEK